MSNVTKEEFKEAIEHVDDRFDAMAAMIARGFEDIARRLDVRERVDALEQKMKKVESALNVRL